MRAPHAGAPVHPLFAAQNFDGGASRLHLWRRKAEGAASGHYKQAGFFLRVVGRALVFARSDPVALALALLLLLLAASRLLRIARDDGNGASVRRGGGGGGGGGFKRSSSFTQRSGTPRAGVPRSPSVGAANGVAAGGLSGADGTPGCIVHAVDGDGASASGGEDDGADGVAAEGAAAPPAAPVHGPIAAPSENGGVVRGVARLLSRAGRDDAAADVAEVFSVLASDFLGRPKVPVDAGAAAAALAASDTADRDWALSDLALSPEVAAAAYVEEVFENSRYMPLQGWGSSYPGHLLPTDRRRWSRFDASICSDALRDIVWLPAGWAWVAVWRKDMRGAEHGAVDSEGWSYAVDFKVRAAAACSSSKRLTARH